MRLMLLTLFTAVTVAAPTDETVLYQRGLQQIEANQYERARFTLQTLINTYPANPLANLATIAIRSTWIRQGITNPDPMLLYQEVQTLTTAGNHQSALLAYLTLVKLYPTSEYAGQAASLVRKGPAN